MTIILGILSVLLIAAILLTPRPKTKEEKQIKEQMIPWEYLDQCDEEGHF